MGHGYKGAYDTLLGTTIEITGFFTTDNTFIAMFYNYGLFSVIIIIPLLVQVVKRILRRGDDIQNCIGMLILSSVLVCFFFECNLFLQASFYVYFFVGSWIGISNRQLTSGNEKLIK